MKDNEEIDSEILIAEDDPANYAFLEVLVDMFGAKHIWAKNGLEVLDILETHKNISVILMDIRMPKMDGITATRKIREMEINIPVIFQTAFSTEENRKECLMAGGNEFISKPINIEKLHSLLKKYTLLINS